MKKSQVSLPSAFRRALPWLGCLLLRAAAAASVDAAPPAAPAGLDVDEIVARNAQARGGIEAWHSLQTLGEKGRIEHGQIKGPKSRHGTSGAGHGALESSLPFTLQIKRPHKMRLEMNLGDAAALQLFDGSLGWTVQPSAGGPVVRRFTEGEAAAAAAQIDPEGPLIDAGAKGTTVVLEGEDAVEGHRAYRLRLSLKNGAQRHVWVDAQTFLDLKIDGQRSIDGRSWPVETYFYDWKSVGGVKIPYRIETAVNDVRSSSSLLVDRVLINAPLADSLFELPGTTAAPPVKP
jgi:hypothetical protein